MTRYRPLTYALAAYGRDKRRRRVAVYARELPLPNGWAWCQPEIRINPMPARPAESENP